MRHQAERRTETLLFHLSFPLKKCTNQLRSFQFIVHLNFIPRNILMQIDSKSTGSHVFYLITIILIYIHFILIY